MRPWTWQRLFAPADEGTDGTGDSDVMEHEFDEPDEPAAAAAKTADPEVETLKQQVAQLTRDKQASDQEAEFWAARARRGGEPQETRTEAEPEEDNEPRITDAKPEALLDDMTARGMDALADRGIVTKKDLNEALKQVTNATGEQIQQARADAEFGLRIADEFPEFADESKKIDEAKARGERYSPTDPHFLLTGKIVREAKAMGTKVDAAVIIMAARQARAELIAEGKMPSGSRKQTQETRRSRIDRLNPSRAAGGEDGEDTGNGFTADQLQVMKHLKVKPDVFAKQATRTASGRGGRRG